MHGSRVAAALAAIVLAACSSSPEPAPPPAWQPWSAAVFERAQQEQRLVLLELGTTWCHWCHVMEERTWGDAHVRAILAADFVTAKADADRRLDLATRYQDYGWPATIVFDANGRELWKLRGFLAPGPMAAQLRRLVDDPRPLPAEAGTEAGTGAAAPAAAGGALSADVERELLERFDLLYDREHGGFGSVHKYLDADAAELLLEQARTGSAEAAARLRQTLAAELRLHDPVWGGVYQYSHGGVWDHPHYEKIASRQLADLRAYSLAFAFIGDEAYLRAAHGVFRYLRDFLRTPDGAFWASQDADARRGEHAGDYFALDDAGRRAIGVPAIDRHVFARENGQFVQGLCALYAVSGDPEVLAVATAAARWILAHRRLDDGAFAHGDDDAGGPFLADSLAMGRALLDLAEVTADAEWLDAAERTLQAIARSFAPAAPGRGFATAAGDGLLPVAVDRAETIALARFANLLHRRTGSDAARGVAAAAMAYAAAPAVALQRGLPADLLLADRELRRAPVHVVVLGRRDDPAAARLFAAALGYAPAYRHVEWLPPGASTRDGVQFPPSDSAVAFVCGETTCSPPIADALRLQQALAGG
jgi:hypothetical protein